MAMLIAWHAVNRARRPSSRHFSDAFLVVAPGITIKDRLRVLKPQDPQNIYEQLDLVPRDLMDAVRKARIVITNYHAFMAKEKEQVSKLNRQILGGREGEKRFTETVGEMIERVGGTDLQGRKNIILLNDEAHHCYRHKVGEDEEATAMTAEERAEAEENAKAARVWISGIEAFAAKIGIEAIYDLSATPFFLRGSGYSEGELFPWVVSDFGLLDAIESGIVKVPRLPVVDDAIKGELPNFRDVYNVIRKENPRAFPMRGRRTQGVGERSQPAAASPARSGHRGALQALRGDVRQVGEGPGAWPASRIHRRVQQYVHVQARLRLDFRLREDRRRGQQQANAHHPRQAAALFQRRRAWALALPLPDLSDRQLATRIRRGAVGRLPQGRSARDRGIQEGKASARRIDRRPHGR